MESAGGGVVGGIGTGDRPFPPTPGLSYSTWFCIDKFSDPRTDPHPVRLLTLARTVKVGTSEDHIQCLAVCLSARDKAFIVSVQETPLARAGTDWQPDFTGENGVRVWFPDLIKEGEWHHLVIVLNRQVIKNSSFSLYVNGQHISTQRFVAAQNKYMFTIVRVLLKFDSLFVLHFTRTTFPIKIFCDLFVGGGKSLVLLFYK